jgi:hypothetical protein
MKRLLNTSSITGSACVPRGVVRLARHHALQHQVILPVTRASHSGSTTVVALRSAMIAGPGCAARVQVSRT